MAPRIVNFAEWSAHLMHRVRRQIAATGDEQLEALYEELSAYPGVELDGGPRSPEAELLLPVRLRAPDGELAFFTTLTTFGTPGNVTLSELAIEAFYPANASTAMRLMRDVTGEASPTAGGASGRP
jgi:hypothetical protein